jgi:hypothetical protein
VSPLGSCVECLSSPQCTRSGEVCDSLFSCVPSGGDGGVDAGTDAGVDAGLPPGDGGIADFDDGGSLFPCLAIDAGVTTCSTTCDGGFECVAGVCVLPGSAGPVQVTLRFSNDEDLDLHLHEPQPDGGICEVDFNKNACGLGEIDVDSNPGCAIDGRNVETITFPSAMAPTPGLYTVAINWFEVCAADAGIPWQVEVRAGSTRRWYCGTIDPALYLPDSGTQGDAGIIVTKFLLH